MYSQSKLEILLSEAEKKAPIGNDDELIKVIQNLIDEEEKKPSHMQDTAFIDEAVSFILELKGLDAEKIEKNANDGLKKILTSVEKKTPSTKMAFKKALILAAAVVSICVIGAILTFGNKYGYRAKNMKRNTKYENGNYEVIAAGRFCTYDTLDKMLEKEKVPEHILLPCDVDADNFDSVTFSDFGDYVTISFTAKGGNITHYEITTNSSSDVLNYDTPIGKYNTYVSSYDNVVAADWEYKGSLYHCISDSFEKIEKFIEKLSGGN